MTEELLKKLIEIVTNTAPELWRIANQQVKANTTMRIVWAVFLFIASTVSAWLIYYASEKYADDEYSAWDGAGAWFVIQTLLCVGMLLALISAVVKRSINPEYYAIKVLMDLVK